MTLLGYYTPPADHGYAQVSAAANALSRFDRERLIEELRISLIRKPVQVA